VDGEGKRWDVLEALNNSGSGEGNTRSRKRNKDVILERWKIELEPNTSDATYDFGGTLPTVYKKCIVFFRSLYSTAKFVPVSKFLKNFSRTPANTAVRVSCRILTGEPQQGPFDALTHPLYDVGDVTTHYILGTTDTPAGQFLAEVSYRNDCNFRVDDSEALLSSRFMGADEHFFQPSLGVRGDSRHQSSKAVEVGSLPAHRRRVEEADPIQAYGSMSTFHGDAPPRVQVRYLLSEPLRLWDQIRAHLL
jgi:autophagy-related protein 13